MTLLFMDGFDHWDIGQYIDKWSYKTAGIATNPSYSRWSSGRGILLGSGNYMYKNFSSTYATLVFGAAIMPTNLAFGDFLKFKEGGTTQVHIDFDGTDDNIKVYRGDSTALLGNTAVNSLASYLWKWLYIEVKVVINSSTGSVQVDINESTVLNLTSQNTQATGNAYVDQIYLGPSQVYMDDLYVDDSTIRGESRVRTFVPDSVSSNINDFTASAGNKDECVDEQPPDEDTTYIYASTVNNRQGFGITTGSLGTVIGMQLNNVVRKDDVGITKIKNLVRSNGTNYLESNEYELTTSYTHNSVIWETDPDDSNAWTQTKLEAAEFGLEITTIP
jgi:hypothetical protein